MTRYALSDLKRLSLLLENVLTAHQWPASAAQAEALKAAEKALFEEITPEFIYVLSKGAPRAYPSLAWAPDMASLREELETDIEAVVWKVSRNDATDSKDVTDDFARQWINDHGDFSEELEDFLHKLGPWLSTHYDDLAREMYLDGQVRDGD